MPSIVGADAAVAAAKCSKKYPLDTIHLAADAEADRFLIEPQVAYVEAVVRGVGPALILVPNTMIGRDVGSRVAARLNAGITFDADGYRRRGRKMFCPFLPNSVASTIVACAFEARPVTASLPFDRMYSRRPAAAGARVRS